MTAAEGANFQNLFDKVRIYLTESNNPKASKVKVFTSKNITPNTPTQFTFNNLYTNRSYDIYVKAFDNNNVHLNYQGLVGTAKLITPEGEKICETTCQLTPSQGTSLDFKLEFTGNADSNLTGEGGNLAILDVMNKWFKGLIDTVNLSNFVKQIQSPPGLKKATCDPTDGGCQPLFLSLLFYFFFYK